ncbi:hypothetical protein [Streptomyces griseofuscus]|uniref:hypothetical protein n=1 Tax=Streptomyces griseofuscus TaxID=146922 RepID=UPI003451F209
MSRSYIRRPTEAAALRAAARSARPLPPVEALFAHLVVADAARDRHGSNLLGHRIARVAGLLPELPE